MDLSYLSKLIALHNKARHLVTGRGWYENAFPLYHKLDLLKLVKFHNFETSKFFYHQIH